jgi:hypothetical protein
MKYVYDYHTCDPVERAPAVANLWGNDGWRWVNPAAWHRHSRGSGGVLMIFEKIIEEPVVPTRRFSPKHEDDLEQR